MNEVSLIDKFLSDPTYKTELCITFISTGFCIYGNRCRFAHGKMNYSTNQQSFLSLKHIHVILFINLNIVAMESAFISNTIIGNFIFYYVLGIL
jgi:hypothetical protein